MIEAIIVAAAIVLISIPVGVWASQKPRGFIVMVQVPTHDEIKRELDDADKHADETRKALEELQPEPLPALKVASG